MYFQNISWNYYMEFTPEEAYIKMLEVGGKCEGANFGYLKRHMKAFGYNVNFFSTSPP